MMLKNLLEEFTFQCQCRRLSPKTTNNYTKQVGYLLHYLGKEHGVTELEGVTPQMIKQFLNVFLSKNGKPLTHEAIEKVVRDAGKALGIEDIRISPHTCRHTFAQMQLKNGLDIYSLSRLMGHESISVIQRYLEGIRDREILQAGMRTSPLMNL